MEFDFNKLNRPAIAEEALENRVSPCIGHEFEQEYQPKKLTLKYDNNKPRLSDVPQKALMSVAKAFNYGADKYSKFNYSHGIEYSRLYDACQRHLYAYMTGEDIDESGNHHIDHAIASLMMLRENIHLGVGVDDRNPAYKKQKI